MKKKLLTLLLMTISLISFQTHAQTYCTANVGPTSIFDSEVTNVSMVGDNFGISNLLTCPGTVGVVDYTSTDSADMSLGTSYTLNITFGTCGGVYTGFGKAWIDWNDDGDFLDANEELGTWSGSPESQGSTTYNATMSVTVPLSATLGETRLRVMQREGGSATTTTPCSSYSWGAVEDYKIVVTNTPPPCPIPGNLTVSGITGSSATATWLSTGTKFDIEYGPAGFVLGTGTQDSSTTASYALSGLTTNTSYDVYVRNNCIGAGNGQSSWAGPVSFTTPCGAITSYPFVESFDDSTSWTPNTGSTYNADVIDNCWDRTPLWSSFSWLVRTGTTPSGNTGPSGDNTSGSANYMYTEASYGSSGNDAYLTLPAFDLSSLTVPFFSFYYHRYGATMGDFALEVSTDTGNTWTSVLTLTGQGHTAMSDPFTEEVVDLTSYKTAHTMVRFKQTRGSSFTGDMAIDDVRMEEAPPCPKPSAVNFSGITSNSAMLNFLSTGVAFPIEYGPAGFTQGTGTTDTALATGYMLTGLFSNTVYDVYIQNNCTGSGNGLSVWAGPFSFRTLCSAFSEGYYQNFDGVASGNLDPCWSELYYGTSSHTVESRLPFSFSQVQPVSTPNLLYWYNAGSTYSYVITPEFTGLDGDTTQIRFKMTNNSFSSSANINVFVGTLSDRSDTSTIQWVDTILTTNRSWTDYTILFDNVPAGHKFVVFGRDNAVTFSEVDIEDFYFEGIPQCLPPTSGSAQATSSTSISASWVGPGTSYDVEYGVQGFTQGTGSVDTNVTGPYAISNLTSNTCYDVYVRNNCGNGSTSPWLGPITVCTPCNPQSMPYSEDFAIWPPSCFSFDKTANWDWDQDPNGHARARFWTFNGGTAYMTSGPVNITQKPRVKFKWAHQYNSSYPNDRLVFMARVQGGTWDTLIDMSGPTFNSPNTAPTTPPALADFIEEKFNLDSATYVGNVAEFQFAATSGYGPHLFVDDFLVEAQPLCTEPDQVTVSSITGYAANLNWNASGGSQFEIEYGPQGFIPGTSSAIVDTTTSTPYTFTGLTPVTCYDVYIRTLCGPNGNSIWTGPIPFCTAVSCPAPTNVNLVSANQTDATIGWTTGSATSWNYVNVAQGFGPGAGTVVFNATNPQTVTGLASGTAYSFYVRDSCGPGDVSAWTGPFDYVTPLCDTSQQCDYTVYMHDSYGDGWNSYEFGLQVGGTTLATFGETFVNSGSFPRVDYEDTAYIAACNGYNTNVVIHQTGNFANEISFEIVSSSGDTMFALAQGSLGSTSPLGSFVPNCIPITCPMPDSLAANNVTANSADLSWVSSGNNFQVSYGMPPFAAPSGTIVTATTNSYSLTSLMGSTLYGFYVREICQVGDTSLWNGPLTFNTLCTTTNLPFDEDMDGINWTPDNTSFGPTFNDAIDQCWSRTSSSGDYNWAVRSSSTSSGTTGPDADASGSGNYMFTEASSPAAQGDVAELTSPVMDLSIAPNADLEFSYHFYGADIDRMFIEGYNGTSWVTLDSIVGQQQTASSAPWLDTIVSLAAFTNADFQVRFRAIRGGGYRGDMAIDEVSISSSAACLGPTNVSVTNTTCTAVEVAWNSDPGTILSGILYDTAGFDPLTGGTMLMPTTSPQTITGLALGTAYDFYVIDSCAAGLSNPVKVTDTTASGPLPVISFTAMQVDTTANSADFQLDASSSQYFDTVEWIFGDGTPNGSTSVETHTYNMNQTYSVTLTLTNDCGSVDTTFDITVYGIDIEETALSRSLSIYPNPTDGQFKVEFTADGKQDITLRVMDALGRVIDNRELGAVAGPQQLELDLSGYASGIYLIQIDSRDGSITKRLTLRNR